MFQNNCDGRHHFDLTVTLPISQNSYTQVRSISVYEAQFWCISINSNTNNTLISILVDKYTHKCYFNYSVVRLLSHVTFTKVAIVKSLNSHVF